MPAKNFAYSTVLTAPSPATSGTSLVVQSGDGANFPTDAFQATIWPAGAQPTVGNAEIVTVSSISTDTFTIVRGQESSSARTVVIGDQIAATLTAKPFGAYAAWTPTVSSASGTITTVSGAGRWIQIGKTVFYSAAITITTNGTGAGAVTFTLPATAQTSQGGTAIGSGREGNVAGKTVVAVLSSATVANIFNYDNSYPGSTGAVIYIRGEYETS